MKLRLLNSAISMMGTRPVVDSARSYLTKVPEHQQRRQRHCPRPPRAANPRHSMNGTISRTIAPALGHARPSCRHRRPRLRHEGAPPAANAGRASRPIHDCIRRHRDTGRACLHDVIAATLAAGELRAELDAEQLIFQFEDYRANANVAIQMSEGDMFGRARRSTQERSPLAEPRRQPDALRASRYHRRLSLICLTGSRPGANALRLVRDAQRYTGSGIPVQRPSQSQDRPHSNIVSRFRRCAVRAAADSPAA